MLLKARNIRTRTQRRKQTRDNEQYWTADRQLEELAHPSWWVPEGPKMTHPPRYMDDLTEQYENIWVHENLDFHVRRRR